MTEIPEHLLKRSQAAKGKATGEEAPSESTAVTPSETAAVASDAAASAGPPALAEAAAAVPADAAPEPAEPVPAYIEAAEKRKKIPVWALPLVASLPIWAIAFAGTMQQPEVEDPLFTESAELYASAGCAGCHGSSGGGGSGYKLSEGSVLETFPEPIDQMVHVARGSAAITDEPYGSIREDGIRVSGSRGVMPAQLNSMSQLELELVVFHERVVLSGEDATSEGYLEYSEELRHRAEEGEADAIDLDFLLACANPGMTPGATGAGSPDEDHPCPGPHEAAEEAAAG